MERSSPCECLRLAHQMVKPRRDEANDEKQARTTRGFKLDESQQCKERCVRFRNVDRQGVKSRNSFDPMRSSVRYATWSTGPSGLVPNFRFHKLAVGRR